ncbi:MAG: enoyl-[acyl-carrier-protein] reductase 2, chloroplastic [Chlamydiales bacterium]|jgi:enoyl-[acyl-carrier protein] reductase I|nr:enoyl-[acyl-carrier-protein] reductase 2, chloroplastic [Chlamydiales bacterium]
MLNIDLRGKKAFIVGIADDQGFGWAIAKALRSAGAEIIVGTWVPVYRIFVEQFKAGKFAESRKLSDGSLLDFAKVYPIDAGFDTKDDVPPEVLENKRYKEFSSFSIAEVQELCQQDFGSIDILVHCLANGPEAQKPLIDTSRKGYLAAVSASSYSHVSLLKYFAPIMNAGGAALSLTYIASERVIPGYGGGLSSAKAALESDTRVLAYEAGQRHSIRVNCISAGPLGSRAAKAIGQVTGSDGKKTTFIEQMIDYAEKNAPLHRELAAEDVANTAAFLLSPLAQGITGATVYVDNGLNTMGVAVDSPTLSIS